MAKVIVQPGHNVRALADHAGSVVKGQIGFRPDNSELEVGDVSQPDLDAALITYAADQANIDAAFQAAQDALTVGELQQAFGDDRIIQAVTEVMRIELNELRALHSLPDIPVGQMDGKVRAKIANP
jgi:hypothetical protein